MNQVALLSAAAAAAVRNGDAQDRSLSPPGVIAQSLAEGEASSPLESLVPGKSTEDED